MRIQVINTDEINYIFSMFEKYANELFISGLNYYLYNIFSRVFDMSSSVIVANV